mmetsp:Transcript_39627/g.77039  ORF Transcript_39627/g.77039 Transcript_39627/m.77039 type:complete len:203 (+) Transcript_39627:421-1029(+)
MRRKTIIQSIRWITVVLQIPVEGPMVILNQRLVLLPSVSRLGVSLRPRHANASSAWQSVCAPTRKPHSAKISMDGVRTRSCTFAILALRHGTWSRPNPCTQAPLGWPLRLEKRNRKMLSHHRFSWRTYSMLRTASESGNLPLSLALARPTSMSTISTGTAVTMSGSHASLIAWRPFDSTRTAPLGSSSPNPMARAPAPLSAT